MFGMLKPSRQVIINTYSIQYTCSITLPNIKTLQSTYFGIRNSNTFGLVAPGCNKRKDQNCHVTYIAYGNAKPAKK